MAPPSSGCTHTTGGTYLIGVFDDAGLTARQIADYVGHDKPSTAQDVYMERGVVGQQAGLALEALSSGRLKTMG